MYCFVFNLMEDSLLSSVFSCHFMLVCMVDHMVLLPQTVLPVMLKWRKLQEAKFLQCESHSFLVQKDRLLCSLPGQMRIIYTQDFPRLAVAAREYFRHETMMCIMGRFLAHKIFSFIFTVAGQMASKREFHVIHGKAFKCNTDWVKVSVFCHYTHKSYAHIKQL